MTAKFWRTIEVKNCRRCTVTYLHNVQIRMSLRQLKIPLLYTARIRTHDPSFMSHLSLKIEQGSRQITLTQILYPKAWLLPYNTKTFCIQWNDQQK